MNSQIGCLAYDPVQSLLAVGTKSTQHGAGQIYLFGRGRIQLTLQLPRSGAGVQEIQFCADKLVCLDSKHDISVYSLELKRLITSHSPPGVVTSMCTDPMLDYVFLGMQTGDILAYDLDREVLAPFKVPILWQEIDPRARVAPVVCLQLHPRDVGTLLVGYTRGAALYSFKSAKAIRFYQYEIPKGAPGGDANPAARNLVRRPKLTQAVWHPTGTFVMIGYDDGSVVFFDAVKDGRMLMARTLSDTNVATPGPVAPFTGNPIAVKEPLVKLAWCANVDPEDTAILVAGGTSTRAPQTGLTLFEMGRTPLYSTSSWDVLSKFFEQPQQQRILPVPPGTEVVDFCLIPRASPHFAGAHDPIAVIALLSSGQLLTLAFPSGHPVTPTRLHISLNFVQPFVRRADLAQCSREKWLGFRERRAKQTPLLQGGAEQSRPVHRSEHRSVAQTVHADGTVKIWDVGHGDEIENDTVLQADVARAVGRRDEIDVVHTSFAGESGELVVGLASGEVVVFRLGVNRNEGKAAMDDCTNRPRALTNVMDRIDPSLVEGLVPFTLLHQQDGPVTAIKMSEIGFVAAGFQGGSIAVIDLRGPAIIYSASVQDVTRAASKGGMRRRGSSAAGGQPEWATSMQFSIMTLEGEDYSSISLHVGTNLGHVATFKILPDPSGRFSVQYAGSVALDNSVLYLAPINTEDRSHATASPRAMAGLRAGLKVNGVLVAATSTAIHLFRPAQSKGAHKSFDHYFCDAAGIIRYYDEGIALLCLHGDGHARAYSIPTLRELASIPIRHILDVRRLADAAIAPTGHVLGFAGPTETALLHVFGTGRPLPHCHDRVFNPAALIPPRPTISNVQWLTGTQHVTPADMDLLVGGPERPPSKRMREQARADAQQQSSQRSGGAAAATSEEEGYWAYMQRQMTERTEKLGLVGDGMDNLEQNSAGWLQDVNKFVGKQKRSAATGREWCPFFPVLVSNTLRGSS